MPLSQQVAKYEFAIACRRGVLTLRGAPDWTNLHDLTLAAR